MMIREPEEKKREFTLTVDGREYRIEVSGNSVRVNGHPFVLGYENGILTIDGIAYDVVLGDGTAIVDGTEYQISAGGMTTQIARKSDQPTRTERSVGAGSVAAIMPGAILKVLVAEGDQVVEGQVVVILEAMKMENEIHAHRTGVIKKVTVKPGDSVENGQVLVEIE